MNQKEIPDRQRNWALIGAWLVPVTYGASGSSWLAAALAGAGVLVICGWLAKYAAAPGRWLRLLQDLWLCLLASELLNWCAGIWPSHENDFAAPLILLALAAYLSAKGMERIVRINCTLLLPVALLTGAVLLSAIPEIRWDYLRPEWQMPDANFITLLIVASLHNRGESERRGKSGILLWAAAAAAAVVTVGTLSPAVSQSVTAPLYELSRSISLLGGAERFESLMAAGMTLGLFAALALTLEGGEEKKGSWIKAGIAGVLFLTGIRPDSRILGIGSIVLWIMIPVICSMKKILKKDEKRY